MKKLPVGIQSFREIITGNNIYVDKTEYIYNLIKSAKYYFLSRPRRFGKSLLLDTIAEAFNGEKELFKGLWIYDSDYAFEKHPVIRLDMSNIANKTPETLENELLIAVKKRAMDEGFDIDYGTPTAVFMTLIEALHKKYNQRVVVLIDEYDKPILDHIGDIEKADANRAVLRGFYGVLKSMDPYLRFTFITGITKFTKTSIFSGLNNLYDLTLDGKYANICGIRTVELDRYFDEHIADLSEQGHQGSYDEICDRILEWYDGYSWDGATRVINPYSILSFFTRKEFASFWYASGTPKFLMDLIKQDPGIYTNLKNFRITEIMLDSSEIEELDAELLLFQTGYLTVKEKTTIDYEPLYTLDIPNNEVRKAFDLHVLAAFSGKRQPRVKQAQIDINEALRAGDMQRVLELLRGLFASIPHQLHIDREAYYHSIFYAVMSVLGFDIEAEVSTSKGRIDAVLECDDKVYVMELKYSDCEPDAAADTKRKLFDKTLGEGMAQIKAKGYAEKFAGSGKQIILVALAFLGRDDIEMLSETM